MTVVEVFADVACPFTHVGLRLFWAVRQQRGLREPVLRLRAWPLELVNGAALDGPSLVPKIAALRATVAPDLFGGFDPSRFPSTTLPALAAEAAAYRHGSDVGERFSLAVRSALFDEGVDVSDHDALRVLREAHGVAAPTRADHAAVRDDYADGQSRGVLGSPHFFTANNSFFCPSLEIRHDDGHYAVSFDSDGFQRFIDAAFD
jgi:predicted DsbA family dithiol-disulfide isomerase